MFTCKSSLNLTLVTKHSFNAWREKNQQEARPRHETPKRDKEEEKQQKARPEHDIPTRDKEETHAKDSDRVHVAGTRELTSGPSRRPPPTRDPGIGRAARTPRSRRPDRYSVLECGFLDMRLHDTSDVAPPNSGSTAKVLSGLSTGVAISAAISGVVLVWTTILVRSEIT